MFRLADGKQLAVRRFRAQIGAVTRFAGKDAMSPSEPDSRRSRILAEAKRGMISLLGASLVSSWLLSQAWLPMIPDHQI
jgi:hypothetical protein